MFQTSFVEEIKTYILCLITSPPHPKIVSFVSNVENIVKPDKPQMTIWRMRNACWIPKATNNLNM